MDRTAQWPKGFQEESFEKPMEGINTRTSCLLSAEKRAIRSPQEHLNCRRCNSTNTKFCYYNNYSLTQPRYLCKTCKRYWTEGGSLRNVPVGGCSRRNKIKSAAASTPSKTPDFNPVLSLSQFSSQNPMAKEAQVLNLAFPTIDKKYHGLSQGNSTSSASSAPLSAFELLRTGMNASRGLNTYIPSPMLDTSTLYYSSAGFHLQDQLKSTPGFSVDGLGTRYEIQENSAKLLFPFGESKQISSTNEVERPSKGQGISTGNWSHAMPNGGYW